MSLIGLIGIGQSHREVQESRAAEAPPAAAAATSSAASAPDPLTSIQSLVKQLETSANTQAIPAHQNW